MYFVIPLYIYSIALILFQVWSGRCPVTVQNWTHVYTNFFLPQKTLEIASHNYAHNSWNKLCIIKICITEVAF